MRITEACRIGAAALAVAFAPCAVAEIEKIATMGDGGIRFTWWPKVKIPDGWFHEHRDSLGYGFNALAPLNASFSNAETVMYARAVYKPREQAKTLDELIANDRADFGAKEPGLEVAELDALATADGKKMRVFAFTPKKGGNWERVAYGEEGEFFLVFVLSSRTAAGRARAVPDFEKLVREYREKP